MDLHPDELFVVACPACQGQVAATGSLCGQDACCPLCAARFHVPFPDLTPPELEPPGEEPDEIEDRRSIDRPTAAPMPAETALIPDETDPTDERAADEPAGATDPAAPRDAEPPWAAGERAGESDLRPDGLPPPCDATVGPCDEPSEPGSAPAEPAFPTAFGSPLTPSREDLAFSEPVRTVQRRGRVIEIRRLTPEERRFRRLRRNVMMIVVGVSILLAVVVLCS